MQSFLDGFNVCIFAYGQTGSGKTHTMIGPEGIVPSSMEMVYKLAKVNNEPVYMACYENHIETVRDLLLTTNVSASLMTNISKWHPTELNVTDIDDV